MSPARLDRALERVRTLASGARGTGLDLAVRKSGPMRFLVRDDARYRVVSEARVLYFDSDGGLTRLIADREQYWMGPSLNEPLYLPRQQDAARDWLQIHEHVVVRGNRAGVQLRLVAGHDQLDSYWSVIDDPDGNSEKPGFSRPTPRYRTTD